jgi:dienelactone hydrolase
MRADRNAIRRTGALGSLTLACIAILACSTFAQVPSAPETLAVRSGALTLRALVWRPTVGARHPAVLFNHGSYSAADSAQVSDPALLGPVFARHGYVLMLLYRQGIGLSRGSGAADGDQMAHALAAEGTEARNRVQLALLQGEELDEARAALALLRARADVDPQRVAVIGHSFGGALSLLLAARDTMVRAAVVFGAAAASWDQSPKLRARLLDAVDRTRAAVLLIHAVNDYSTTPGKALDVEMRRAAKVHALKIYPAFGATTRQGHNFLFHDIATWESDVFDFLAAHLRPSNEARPRTKR